MRSLISTAFVRLWIGNTASGLATWALPFVFGFAVIDGHLSATDLGIALAARTIGLVIVALDDRRFRGWCGAGSLQVADLTNPLWDRIVVHPRYRCLIPLTHFANLDGVKGAKTRSWFSKNRQPLMAWAGICKNTPDFGPVFAGMTMTANEKIRPFNYRMPVLLERQEYDRWLHGSIEDVIAFQFRDPPPSDARPFARGRVRTVAAR